MWNIDFISTPNSGSSETLKHSEIIGGSSENIDLNSIPTSVLSYGGQFRLHLSLYIGVAGVSGLVVLLEI